MVQRRSFLNRYDGFEEPPDSEFIGGDFNPGGRSLVDEPAPADDGWQTDVDGSDRPPGFFMLSPEEQEQIRQLQSGAIGGNQDTAREFGAGALMKPTTPLERPQEPQLPQGVSVEERSGGAENLAFDTPPQSFAPAPIAAGTPEPMKTAVGPQRRTISNAAPALFAEGGGARMFGDAGGLLSGGRGVLGANAGGPTPTEMMLSIMRQLQGGR